MALPSNNSDESFKQNCKKLKRDSRIWVKTKI